MMSGARVHVAICQPRIMLGGRLRVILGIVEILNQAGVIPDILTGGLSFSSSSIPDYYGKSIEANFRILPLPRVPRLDPDLEMALFNSALYFYTRHYDLLINTSNSLLFLPRSTALMSYVFFPRKRRIMSDIVDLHLPDDRGKKPGLQRRLLKVLYRSRWIGANHTIVSMTHFTLSALSRDYDLPYSIPVIYPPVDVDHFWQVEGERDGAVVSIGRFAPEKRQLEQIKLASHLPDLQFHIVGFAGGNSYYNTCATYVRENDVTNVTLHPDADFGQLIAILKRCKFFLHTLVNEPFGLTAVQAMAAGCLPVVHDSGGQRETVPISELRYDNLDEVPSVMRYLLSLTREQAQQLRSELQEHVRSNFAVSVFHARMEEQLQPLLGQI